jgi:hypothetical protein
MADPSIFDAVRIPSEVLIALDNREFHFALQPWHYLVRVAHIVSMAAFFGGIALLDVALMGFGGPVHLRAILRHVVLWLYASFVAAVVSGVMLFLYDPVHVGSHAYFAPKLILIVLGLANAAIFSNATRPQVLTTDRALFGSALSCAPRSMSRQHPRFS